MPAKNYIISLDIGTTHVKALLTDLKARKIDVVLQDYRILYPGPGMVEQDPDELLEATINSISELILKNNIKSNDINKFKVKTILGIVGGSDGPLSHLGSLGSTDNKISLTVGTGSAIRLLKHNPTVIPGKEAWCYYLNVYFFYILSSGCSTISFLSMVLNNFKIVIFPHVKAKIEADKLPIKIPQSIPTKP